MSDKMDSIEEAPKASLSEECSVAPEVKKKKTRARKSTSKAQTKKTTARVSRKSNSRAKEPVQDNLGNIKESEHLPDEVSVENEKLGKVELQMSKALHRKLLKQSFDEGVGLEDFITELLAEGVVLRAWEIVERKNAMRGGNQSANGNHRSKGQGGNSKGYKNKGHRMSHGRYQSIMDDSSNFLEYVRNQERGRR